jgi:hypothetical protein
MSLLDGIGRLNIVEPVGKALEAQRDQAAVGRSTSKVLSYLPFAIGALFLFFLLRKK